MAKKNKRNRKKTKQPVLYFAFGSNLDAVQMKARCPSASHIANAHLDDWQLEFAGWSSGWGGSVANIEQKKGSKCPGVVWQVSRKDLAKLDRFEGHPWCYRRQTVWVSTPNGAMECFTYIMDYAFPCGSPSAGYVAKIASGYDRFKLNEDHLWDAIRNVEELDTLQGWGDWHHAQAIRPPRAISNKGKGTQGKPSGSAASKMVALTSDRVSRFDGADPTADQPTAWGLDGPIIPEDLVSDDPAVVQAALDGYIDDDYLDSIEEEIARQDAEFASKYADGILTDPFGVSDDPADAVAVSAQTKIF